jgi:hypothetical protein
MGRAVEKLQTKMCVLAKGKQGAIPASGFRNAGKGGACVPPGNA